MYLPFPITGKFLYENLIPNTKLTELTSRNTSHSHVQNITARNWVRHNEMWCRWSFYFWRGLISEQRQCTALHFALSLSVSRQHVRHVKSIQKVSDQLPQEENGPVTHANHFTSPSPVWPLSQLSQATCLRPVRQQNGILSVQFCEKKLKPLGNINAVRVTEEIHRARIYIYFLILVLVRWFLNYNPLKHHQKYNSETSQFGC